MHKIHWEAQDQVSGSATRVKALDRHQKINPIRLLIPEDTPLEIDPGIECKPLAARKLAEFLENCQESYHKAWKFQKCCLRASLLASCSISTKIGVCKECSKNHKHFLSVSSCSTTSPKGVSKFWSKTVHWSWICLKDGAPISPKYSQNPKFWSSLNLFRQKFRQKCHSWSIPSPWFC
jgi:hypothetical protein